MKTTLELEDELLIEAKAVAARRRITLKTLVENALRRELQPPTPLVNPDPARFEVGPLGFLVLKRGAGAVITSEQIHAMQEEIDDEDTRRALRPGGA